ncbi:MAG: hypothetical protein ACREP2_02190 [Rhodanobacteraceae bacterium]
MAGVKAYTACLREHGVKFDEYAVDHETGGNTYEIPEHLRDALDSIFANGAS